MTSSRRILAILAVAVAVAAIAVAVTAALSAGPSGGSGGSRAIPAGVPSSGISESWATRAVPKIGTAGGPRTPPARICGDASVLNGPAKAPAGARKVPAGDNEAFDFSVPGTTYWFAPGTHTLGTGQYSSIIPGEGDTYVGAPGAVLSGETTSAGKTYHNSSAFGGAAERVTISYLTIENFGTWGGEQQEGTVNHDSGKYWKVDHSTITGNAGAGVMLGSHDTLSYNCLRANQQYGFSAYSGNGAVTNLVLDHNEIAGNDTYNYEVVNQGCGCSGGGKFWNVVGAVVTNNWVVGNRSVGLWADTNNAGFLFKGNYIQNSQGVGLQYEISYNATIEDNTFAGNGIGYGAASGGFPVSAIYLSESGSDSRVNTAYKARLLVAHNNFSENWSGVILWENSNRFCGSPDNSSTGYCTMVDPQTVNLRACSNARTIKRSPYLADCRWKTQNVLVEQNSFSFDPSAIGKSCTIDNGCGYNGVFSEYGSDPSWSPYQGETVPDDITYRQNNNFAGNDYAGPWCFMGWEQGTSVAWRQWTAKVPRGAQPGSGFAQDAGSAHSGPTRPCS
jgi:parallel beta helix pectate lyase-like protein